MGFSKQEQKEKALNLQLEAEPDLVVGSPMCKEFSPWQRNNKAKSSDPGGYEERKKEAITHLEFSTTMHKNQHYAGRLFLHEHPTQASSWEEECMQELISLPGVSYVDMHQC